MIDLLYIDLFCGAGGTSTGVERARVDGEQCSKVIACVNHDANAIASHAANHPDALHFTEDIRSLELSPLLEHMNKWKCMYPNAKIVLWASLECTNFSKAKGGLPRDADSRTLAEHLFRYIDVLNPDYIQIENVEEFMSWGDLDEKGKPISKTNGKLYQRWIYNVQKYGYAFDFKIMNAADYSAPTSRKRYFGQFAKDGLPIVWPKPTHCKGGSTDLFSDLKKWEPVKNCLDFTDEGNSIFDRKKELAEPSKDRVMSGLIKFVGGGKENHQKYVQEVEKWKEDNNVNIIPLSRREAEWLLKYNSVNKKTGKHNPPSVDEPCPTVTVQNRLGIVRASFISKYFSGHPESKNKSINEPVGAITTIDHHSLVNTKFISKYYSGNSDYMVSVVNEPAPTVRTKDGQALVSPRFLSAYYGNGHNSSVESPSPTVTTRDRLSLVNPKFLCSYNYKDEPKDINSPCPTLLTKDRFSLVTPFFMNNYSGGGQTGDINNPCPAVTTTPKQNLVQCHFIDQQFGQSKAADVNKPLGAVTTNPKYNLVSCRNWIMNTNFGNVGSSINDPSPTITANRKWHYLMDAQYGRVGRDVDQPCFTLIARMDKTPPYLMEVTQETKDIPSFIKIVGNVIIYEIYDTDSPKTKEIKEFMAMYGILDIKMRMLRIPELKKIMGFPEDYVLIGTQADQKKFIGNAVHTIIPKVMSEATSRKLRELNKKVA